jgi:AraC-like DNA-binding protein
MDAAEAEVVAPPEALKPFVRRFLYINRRLEAPVTVRPKPTGYSFFVNYFGSPPDSVTVDGKPVPLIARWHLPGQIVDHDIVLQQADIMQVLWCELGATGLYRLFGIPGARTVGKAPPLAEAAPQIEPLARAHFVRGPEASRDEHVAEAIAFFGALAERAGPGDPLVEPAVGCFENAHGAVRVADVCRQLDVSTRHLNRRFQHIVGVPPKFFAQILQINWVVGLLFFNDTETLTRIAHEAGFYDQAHFGRAMRRFFNEGPGEFLRSKHVLFKEFIGTSRQFGPSAPSE